MDSKASRSPQNFTYFREGKNKYVESSQTSLDQVRSFTLLILLFKHFKLAPFVQCLRLTRPTIGSADCLVLK